MDRREKVVIVLTVTALFLMFGAYPSGNILFINDDKRLPWRGVLDRYASPEFLQLVVVDIITLFYGIG